MKLHALSPAEVLDAGLVILVGTDNNSYVRVLDPIRMDVVGHVDVTMFLLGLHGYNVCSSIIKLNIHDELIFALHAQKTAKHLKDLSPCDETFNQRYLG